MRRVVVVAEAARNNATGVTGIATGFADLDKMLGGLQRCDLVIVAGRPAMGKTALATKIATNAAAGGKNAAFFSLEMSNEQLGARVLAGETGIASDWVRRGALSGEQMRRLNEAQRETAWLPLNIDDTPAQAIAGLRSRARRHKRRAGLDLIVIDYLQLLVAAPRDGRADQNRVQEVSEITRGLKALAKELEVPVVALSQLSRAVEARDDKRPLLSDLRELGSIEQDADVVIFVYREEYYLREPPLGDADKHAAWQAKMAECRNKAEVIVAKHRNGPVGTVGLRFDHQTTQFSNLAGSGGSGGFSNF